jgi:hypothetical protein
MTSSSGYLRMRTASEAGLISEIIRVLSADAKRIREQSAPLASRAAAFGRGGGGVRERTGSARREMTRSRRAQPSDR